MPVTMTLADVMAATTAADHVPHDGVDDGGHYGVDACHAVTGEHVAVNAAAAGTGIESEQWPEEEEQWIATVTVIAAAEPMPMVPVVQQPVLPSHSPCRTLDPGCQRDQDPLSVHQRKDGGGRRSRKPVTRRRWKWQRHAVHVRMVSQVVGSLLVVAAVASQSVHYSLPSHWHRVIRMSRHQQPLTRIEG